ncbi:hypothetical protein BKA62DRAFT_772398 [Auriculariales sp. MPI-PUGE-AT-0066]|nr:hypothetical protein BKA62DRAFT_772398 [Auriculariales sp. MPI-PUGE-AT-0066]
MHPKLHYLLTVLFFALVAHARLSGVPKACWHRNCIYQSDPGTICLETNYNARNKETCADPILQRLLDRHVADTQQSITYYDEQARPLGAALWRLPDPPTTQDGGAIFVCMTGQRIDLPYLDRTICRHALRDEDQLDFEAHKRECFVEHLSKLRADYCKPARWRPWLDRAEFAEHWSRDHPVKAGVIGSVVTLVVVHLCRMNRRRGGVLLR